MRYIDHGNIRIATQAFGNPEGPAVIMVMGATASMLLWPEALMQGLAAGGLHVIRFDHRDTGETTTVAPGAADHVVEDLAADVLAVLDAYGIARAHVVGMSLGGYIGQMLALTAPDRVASLTLVAAEPLGWDGDPLPHISDAFMAHFAGMADLDWSDADAVTAFLVGIDRLSAGSGAPFDAGAAETRARRVLARTDSVASMFNHAALTTRDDWTGRFRDIARPVLVLHGIDDPVLPIENGRALAAGIPAARIVELAGVGHELPVRAIGQMVDTIAGFVAGQD
ncbi:alpha/beta hydrolase [uncultured Maritimibacter sp.]|uniref:alpha/beta fold hydrolase n=1 Tax=uncultured Maritimibacter sp. TaxID=991866 RepID=UPI00263464A8|nr:alpha/beta hydrolase [uncultured Maritimibacter sp.]